MLPIRQGGTRLGVSSFGSCSITPSTCTRSRSRLLGDQGLDARDSGGVHPSGIASGRQYRSSHLRAETPKNGTFISGAVSRRVTRQNQVTESERLGIWPRSRVNSHASWRPSS
jgi:hypothetical protein